MSRTAAASWPIDWDHCSSASNADDSQRDAALASAQSWLYAASGGRYGSFTTIEDGYRPACSDVCGGPYKNAAGLWRNGLRDAHLCCRIELQSQPVRAIDSVTVHDVLLDAADYALEGNDLLRLGACWECCEDCEPACVVVGYQWGIAPDSLAIAAVEELACELVAGFTGQTCKLPSRAVSVSRQGVTIDMDDAATFAERGLTGLPITDAWIRSVNPTRLVTRSRAYSPDAARRA